MRPGDKEKVWQTVSFIVSEKQLIFVSKFIYFCTSSLKSLLTLYNNFYWFLLTSAKHVIWINETELKNPAYFIDSKSLQLTTWFELMKQN